MDDDRAFGFVNVVTRACPTAVPCGCTDLKHCLSRHRGQQKCVTSQPTCVCVAPGPESHRCSHRKNACQVLLDVARPLQMLQSTRQKFRSNRKFYNEFARFVFRILYSKC